MQEFSRLPLYKERVKEKAVEGEEAQRKAGI